MSGKIEKKLPRKRDLTKGNVINIVGRDGILRGSAKLIERKPSAYTQDLLPYAFKEKTNATQDTTLTIHSFERWLVEWVTHSYYRVGDRSAVECHFFVKVCAQYPSFSEPIYSEHDTTGKVIFIEEPGVLSLGGEYIPTAFTVLKAVKKKFRGEIIAFTHNRIHLQEQFEIHEVGRILEFLSTDTTYSDAVITYLYDYKDDIEDFLIISGDSCVKGVPNILQCNSRGLRRK